MPIQLENIISAVDISHIFLGSNIVHQQWIVNEVSARLGKATRVIGCLQSSIFGFSIQIVQYCGVVWIGNMGFEES